MLCVSAFHNSISLNAVFNASLLSQEEVIELGRDIEEEAEILLEAIEFHEKKVLWTPSSSTTIKLDLD